MSLEIISKEYADSTFASGPVVKTITSSDGSVSVFTDGPNVDLKVKSGGGDTIALGDIKAKAFNFGLYRNGNDWMFDGETIVNIFKSLDGFNHVDIGAFSFNDANWGPYGAGGEDNTAFYSQPVTIYFSKETSINEILSNFTDSLIEYDFKYAYPLMYIAGNW